MTVEMNLQRGLVGHWTMNSVDVDNGVIRDQSGNRNDGTLNSVTLHYPGINGESVNFSPSDGGIVIPHDDIFDTLSDGMTVSLWFYSRQNKLDGEWGLPIDKNSFTNSQFAVFADNVGSDTYRFNTTFGDTEGNYERPDYDGIPYKEWHMLTMRFRQSDQECAVYFDGDKKDTRTLNTSEIVVNDTDIELGYGGEAGTISGLIDDVRIYNRTLSDKEIEQLYNIRGDRAYGSPYVPQRPVAAGDLVAWYPFEGQASDATAFQQWAADDADYSGTVNGATHQESGGVTDIRHGPSSSGYDFNSSNSENIELFNHGLSSHSLSCWFNTDTLNYNNGGSNALIFGYYDGGGAKYTIINMNGGNMNFRIDDGNNSYAKVAGSSINADQWYHAVLTYDSSTGDATGYLDGSSIGSNSYTGDITFDTGPYYVGGNPVNGTDFDGTVDDVRIYNKSLSQVEIEQIYANTKP